MSIKGKAVPEYRKETMERARMFQNMGNPVRLCILQKLHHKNRMCVSEFCACMDASQPLISKHLKHLKDAGILKSDTKGQFVWYELIDNSVLKVLDALDQSE